MGLTGEQNVQINNQKQNIKITASSGIPQGSAIGPKLFILCINDIHEISKKLNFLFADDTTVYRSGNNLELVSSV